MNNIHDMLRSNRTEKYYRLLELKLNVGQKNSDFMQNLQLAEVLKLCCNWKDQFTINLHVEKEKKW